MLKTTIKAAALAVAAAMIAAAAPAGAADKLKVGYVYVGPVGDLGYSYQHDVGRIALQKALGDKVETTFVENVPEGADAERVIAQLAQSGHGLIFTTSFGFMNPTLKVAQRFPKVKFEHATGYKRAANVATYSARFHEGRTVIGAIAGKMTKSGKIGYIASFPIPEVVSGINAFTLSLKKVRPDAEVSVVWVNSWYDPGKEAEAAKALIAQGADVLSQHTDSPAPVQAAEAAGIYAFGQSSDMAKFGPKAHLTSITDDWDGYYINRAKAVLDGKWKSEDTWGGLDSGMVVLSPYNPGMPKDVAAMADQIKNDLIAHKITSFDGPFKNRDGKEVIPAGQHLNDQQILTMNYFVQGVKGDLPK